MVGDSRLTGAIAAFEFATAARIRFGAGVLAEIGEEAAQWGTRALIVSGSSSQNTAPLEGLLDSSGVSSAVYRTSGEPNVANVTEAVRLARDAVCDLVIGFGGGSAIDTAKAAAILLTNPGDLVDYLEVVGRGQPLSQPGAPFLALPTTAGTGSEVTRNAVLSVPEKQVKVSLRSPMMLARAAFVDPQLTYSMPPAVTAATGMDALAQLIEPYVSRRANPLTDLLCREGIRRVIGSLRRAYQNGNDHTARADMSLSSLLSGLALANAGLGVVHGLAGPVGGMFEAPHGAVCAALLPGAVLVNSRVLSADHPAHPALLRYLDIASMVSAGDAELRPVADVTALVEWLDTLRVEIHIPGLREYGVTEASLGVLAEKGAAASSTKANPVMLTSAQLREILTLAL